MIVLTITINLIYNKEFHLYQVISEGRKVSMEDNRHSISPTRMDFNGSQSNSALMR
jgi:hypothetical protein